METLVIALQIVSFILEKGVPAWINISQAWAKADPTLTDFETLKSMMRRPEDF